MARYECLRPYIAGIGGVLAKRLVQLSGETVIHNTAAATDDAIGVTEFSADVDLDVTVCHLGDDTLEITAATAFAAGVDVFAAADGKVQVLPVAGGTYRRVGKSLEAATADGDIVEILPYNDGKTVTVP